MSDERWNKLGLQEAPAEFVGPTQKARAWTEGWIAEQMFCPNCSANRVTRHKANNPAADFVCRECEEEYELKSQRTRFSRRVVDGAFSSMMSRMEQGRAPNLLLLHYNRDQLRVSNLIVIPKQFFVPSVIEARPPLASTARRAGWQGCNIVIADIPDAGKVWMVRDGQMRPQTNIVEDWRSTLFMRQASTAARGWLIEVMKCVEEIGRQQFDLADVYAFEGRLSDRYPSNSNVRPKIRQQLQVLRDQGFLEFLGDGRYQLRSRH